MFRLLLFTFMLFQFSSTAQPNTDLLDTVVKEQQDIEYQKAVNYIRANYPEFAEMTTNEEKLAKAIKMYRESRVDKTGLVLLFLFNIALATSFVLMLFPRFRKK